VKLAQLLRAQRPRGNNTRYAKWRTNTNPRSGAWKRAGDRRAAEQSATCPEHAIRRRISGATRLEVGGTPADSPGFHARRIGKHPCESVFRAPQGPGCCTQPVTREPVLNAVGAAAGARFSNNQGQSSPLAVLSHHHSQRLCPGTGGWETICASDHPAQRAVRPERPTM